METKTNLSSQSNLSVSLTKMMDSDEMTAGRSYRPLSTEKRIPRSISQQYSPTLHFIIQIYQMDLDETVAERIIDDRTRGNENKQGFRNETQHEQEAKLQNNGNTKPNGPKSFHTTSSKQELGNPNILQSKTSLPQLTHLQNQAKLNEKLLYPNNGYCQPQTITLKAKQACIVRTQQVLKESRSQSQLRLFQPFHSSVGLKKKGKYGPCY
ncbi:MAG: hypothetical protein EZS28_027118 [Streblomastix strix]|uniref:Uncharacterized protein n=1 Tax=Streblomastix strix TaxID=222440 RepID=A0A5J4V491_9EUKA|nr:MAG: hypothetical protein EZS28_027118 [Streblomastix strix]